MKAETYEKPIGWLSIVSLVRATCNLLFDKWWRRSLMG
jgi:hypothetical protein